MTVKSIWNRLEKSSSHVDLLMYLFERWNDESEYEDIDSYLKKVQEVIPEAYSISEHEFIIKARGIDGELQIHFEYEGEDRISMFPLYVRFD